MLHGQISEERLKELPAGSQEQPSTINSNILFAILHKNVNITLPMQYILL